MQRDSWCVRAVIPAGDGSTNVIDIGAMRSGMVKIPTTFQGTHFGLAAATDGLGSNLELIAGSDGALLVLPMAGSRWCPLPDIWLASRYVSLITTDGTENAAAQNAEREFFFWFKT